MRKPSPLWRLNAENSPWILDIGIKPTVSVRKVGDVYVGTNSQDGPGYATWGGKTLQSVQIQAEDWLAEEHSQALEFFQRLPLKFPIEVDQ
jgi:hypothetical protein